MRLPKPINSSSSSSSPVSSTTCSTTCCCCCSTKQQQLSPPPSRTHRLLTKFHHTHVSPSPTLPTPQLLPFPTPYQYSSLSPSLSRCCLFTPSFPPSVRPCRLLSKPRVKKKQNKRKRTNRKRKYLYCTNLPPSIQKPHPQKQKQPPLPMP